MYTYTTNAIKAYTHWQLAHFLGLINATQMMTILR